MPNVDAMFNDNFAFNADFCKKFKVSFLFSGLLWRYLKLAFAYDRADLEEFFKLKTIQTYVQSLPLVTIHLAWVLATHQQPMILSYSVFSNDVSKLARNLVTYQYDMKLVIHYC